MLNCLVCGVELQETEDGFSCVSCEKRYPRVNGIYVFLEKDMVEVHFPRDSFDRLYRLEKESFWFNVRNKIIGRLIEKYLPEKKSKILEIGCGTGYVSRYIMSLGYSIDLADIMKDGLEYAKKRCETADCYLVDSGQMPFENHYDSVCAFDILEHVEDDQRTLYNINRSLKEGGLLFITVPARKDLWSKTDENALHQRRYEKNGLVLKLHRAGFNICKSSYFMMFLLPLTYTSRKIIKNEPTEELMLNPILNSVFYHIFNIESYLIEHVDLPIGSSIICVAKKGASDE